MHGLFLQIDPLYILCVAVVALVTFVVCGTHHDHTRYTTINVATMPLEASLFQADTNVLWR